MSEIIVALDVASLDSALALVDRLGDRVGFYKVGSPLYTRVGREVVEALRGRGKRIFLDLKFHDIPNTVASAVKSAAELGVELLTLHTSGGSAMMRAAREAAGERGPKLLGVTVLTSFGEGDLAEAWGRPVAPVAPDVTRLAALAAQAGLAGVVASPLECAELKRRHGPAFLVVTPGIRPAGAGAGDQTRTATPAAAAAAGADYLVVGRPVLESADPRSVVTAMQEELALSPGPV